jgi:hypothetical protein
LKYRAKERSQLTFVVVDLIVAEAIYSFELNIALFDEIQELSEAKQLHATLAESGIEYVSPSTSVKSTVSRDWLVGFATGAATVALGLSIYHRISERL